MSVLPAKFAFLSRHRRIGLLALTAFIAALIWAVSSAFTSEEAPAYQTAEATRGDLKLSITASGSMQAKDYVDVGAQVSGQLEKVFVEVGDEVERGELLAEIDATLLKAQVEAQQARLDELNAQLAQQKADAELAAQQHARNKRLFASKAVSEDTVQVSAAAEKVAIARVQALEAQIRATRSDLEADEANLNYTKIYAPITGTVVSQTSLEGQTLNANQTAPTILRISDLSVMRVSAEVSEADVVKLTPGMPVYFTTLGLPDRRWQGTLRQVLPEPEVLNDVVLYKALIDVANEDGVLLPQMTAQVFFVEGAAANAVLVPSSAVITTGGTGGKVLIPAGNGRPPEERRVEIGLQGRMQTEILSGLEEGEKVILGQAGAAIMGASSQRGPRRMMGPML